jgi:molybdenum cofactor cytidylyltransferase
MSEKYRQIVAVVLAAGAARRFGRPKQLERFPTPDSPTLIERAVSLALEAQAAKVFVVTGNQREKVEKVLKPLHSRYDKLLTVYNEHWELGQGFSVAAGVKAVQQEVAEAAGILFMLTDQPRLKTSTLTSLMDDFWGLETNQEKILFPVYEGKRGNPVIFGRAFFDELAQLNGDSGGRMVVRAHPAAAHEVEVDDHAIHEDVDTPEDFDRLVSGNGE